MLTEELLQSKSDVESGDEVYTRGHRHLLQLLDYHARIAPERIYASVPLDPDNLSAGFRDISYGEFTNAINHCAHWLNKSLPLAKGCFETVAYTGPKDIRYPILACAIAKLERKLLLPSPSATPAAQAHLVRKTNCRILLYGGEFRNVVSTVAREVQEWSIDLMAVPEVESWLRNETADEWRWKKTWKEVREMPWFIVHTSGTTGFPKPITYTHRMMMNFDASELMPEARSQETIVDHMQGRRWFSPLPTLHLVGMYIALQGPIVCGGVAVFGPPGNITPAIVRDTLRYGNCQVVSSPPLFIEALASDPVGLETLQKLDFVYFAGAPLSQPTAEKLLLYTRILPMFGTTEVGKFFIVLTGEDDWQYHTFRESNGIAFERVDGDLHELVLARRAELERWQQIFWVYPELDVFRTGDLWVEHKSKPGAWKVVGRTDDLVVFSHGKKINAAEIEMELSLCPGVAGVVIGGQNRDRPFVLVEWAGEELDEETKFAQLWPAIENVNERLAEVFRIRKQLVLFTAPGKSLVRNVKGGPVRKASLKLYEEEIEQLYGIDGMNAVS